MARPISVLELTAEEEAELSRRVRASTTAARDILRARIVLLRGQGMKQTDVARAVDVSTTSVNKWSQRFERLGLDGLTDRAGRGVKASISPAVVEAVVAKAGQDASGLRAGQYAHHGGRGRHLGVERRSASGANTASSRTSSARSSCRTIRNSKPNSGMSWGCISIHRSGPSCCAATRRHRSRRWNARNRGCRSVPATSAPRPTTMSDTAPSRCLQR